MAMDGSKPSLQQVFEEASRKRATREDNRTVEEMVRSIHHQITLSSADAYARAQRAFKYALEEALESLDTADVQLLIGEAMDGFSPD
jgi:hypothetical protein